MAKTTLNFEKPIIDLEQKIEEMKKYSDSLDLIEEIKGLEENVNQLRKSIYDGLTRWQKVQLARHPDRPYTLDYVGMMTTDFVELHGDRGFRDEGRDTKSNLYRNFGMPNPEGYRKALRLMKLAAKFQRPVITMLDTPGAYPGLEAEERGQAEAIARNLFEMSHLPIPIIVVVIGEGASGGALGIGVGDRILMMENTWYSVISPESCSSILWRSWDYKEQAAEALKLTAPDLLAEGIIDRIVPEPLGGAHRNPQEAADILKDILLEEVKKLKKVKIDKLIERRIEKFASMGEFEE
ncbi:MAG: acetyl-CoA carboxylase carboxyltransferase subunit alpha [Ignavibacteria bacterium 13_1_40CM_2_61_4]|nr:MAG: acetyl-CoA carboxylase carboxyltransferase subunit alpha [Ignavibacteria bacterium 13_1_40CM_2_61_4]